MEQITNPLYDWLDKMENIPEGTTTLNILKEKKAQGYEVDEQQLIDLWNKANGKN